MYRMTAEVAIVIVVVLYCILSYRIWIHKDFSLSYYSWKSFTSNQIESNWIELNRIELNRIESNQIKNTNLKRKCPHRTVFVRANNRRHWIISRQRRSNCTWRYHRLEITPHQRRFNVWYISRRLWLRAISVILTQKIFKTKSTSLFNLSII